MIKKEFLSQWNSFSAIIESEMIRRLKEDEDLSIERLNTLIKREAAKWQDSSQYEGIWLHKLSKRNSAIASEFKKIIGNIRILPTEETAIPSTIPYALGILGTGIAGYFISTSLKIIRWKVIGYTLVPAFLVGTILLQLWHRSKEEYKRKVVLSYVQQLDYYKNQLLDLCEKVDA